MRGLANLKSEGVKSFSNEKSSRALQKAARLRPFCSFFHAALIQDKFKCLAFNCLEARYQPRYSLQNYNIH
jgi:hypothetical protein